MAEEIKDVQDVKEVADKANEVKNVPAKTEKVSKKANEKAAKDAAKKKKDPLGKRIAKRWKDFRAEFKKIVWYSRKDTWNSTILVLVTIIVLGAIIAALDFAFSTGLTALGSLF